MLEFGNYLARSDFYTLCFLQHTLLTLGIGFHCQDDTNICLVLPVILQFADVDGDGNGDAVVTAPLRSENLISMGMFFKVLL